MLDDDFDWDAHAKQGYPLAQNTKDVWGQVAGETLDDTFWAFPVPLAGCGSTHHLEGDPVAAMYRFLFYARPGSVAFSDMYDASLCGVVSTCGRFAAVLALFMYKPCLLFYCLPTLAQDDSENQALQTRTGLPGVDTVVRCTDPIGKAWFAFITKAVSTVTTVTIVYGGNNFEV